MSFEEHICLFLWKSGFCLRQAKFQQQASLCFCFNSSFRTEFFKNLFWNKFKNYRKVSNTVQKALISSLIQIFQMFTYTSSTLVCSHITFMPTVINLFWNCLRSCRYDVLSPLCISLHFSVARAFLSNPHQAPESGNSIDSASAQSWTPSDFTDYSLSRKMYCLDPSCHSPPVWNTSSVFSLSFVSLRVVQYMAYILKVDP